AVRDVLKIGEEKRLYPAAKNKGAIDAEIELPKLGNARPVVSTEHRIETVGARVVHRADDRCSRIAGRIAKACAHAPPADLLAEHDREYVRLIEVEGAIELIAVEATLALADCVRHPAEEASPHLLPEKKLHAVRTTLAVLREGARADGILKTASDDNVLERFV